MTHLWSSTVMVSSIGVPGCPCWTALVHASVMGSANWERDSSPVLVSLSMVWSTWRARARADDCGGSDTVAVRRILRLPASARSAGRLIGGCVGYRWIAGGWG